jgi:DNA polymerase III alpha subunit (gram-positive type)
MYSTIQINNLSFNYHAQRTAPYASVQKIRRSQLRSKKSDGSPGERRRGSLKLQVNGDSFAKQVPNYVLDEINKVSQMINSTLSQNTLLKP